MTRRRKRENLYLMLFQMDFHAEADIEEQADIFLEELEDDSASQKVKKELKERFLQVRAHLGEIDGHIEKTADGWELSRLAKADLTVLRLAVFEILFDADVPDGVAISEAVELAKRYGGDKSYRFVNGILGTIARQEKA